MSDSYPGGHSPSATDRVYFLGGRDLEMVTIREVLESHGREFHDKQLAWGARASDYDHEIRESLSGGRQPVLVELPNDLPSDVASRVEEIDHHGRRAGIRAPTALEQVLAQLGIDQHAFAANRHWQLVAANDRGHIRGMRHLAPPATDEEVRRIRLADLAAQGVSDEALQAARRAASECRVAANGRLSIVDCDHDRTGLIADMMEPLFGGPGFENLLVLGHSEAGFYGEGWLVERLAELSPEGGCWFGGSLPEFGFWGAALESLGFDVESVLVGLLSADGILESPPPAAAGD